MCEQQAVWYCCCSANPLEGTAAAQVSHVSDVDFLTTYAAQTPTAEARACDIVDMGCSREDY